MVLFSCFFDESYWPELVNVFTLEFFVAMDISDWGGNECAFRKNVVALECGTHLPILMSFNNETMEGFVSLN